MHLNAPVSDFNSQQNVSFEVELLILVTTLSCLAYACWAFLGVALLGLAILFVSLQFEMDTVNRLTCLETHSGSVGPLQAERLKPGRAIESQRILRALFWTKLLGFALAGIGIGALVM